MYLERTLKYFYYLCIIIFHQGSMTGQQITTSQRFKTDGDCYEYLAGIKWQRDEFVCKKCSNKISARGAHHIHIVARDASMMRV